MREWCTSGTPNSWSTGSWNRAEQLQRIVRVPGADLSISKEDLEQFQEIVFGPEPTPAQLRWFSQQALPETKPAFSDLLVDTEGYVWLEVYRHRMAGALDFAPQAVSDWNVFSPAGEWLGSVRLPARFEVFEIGRDYVLGRKLDEEDVPHPQLLRLDRH